MSVKTDLFNITNSYYTCMASSARGQDGAILPTWDYLPHPARKISPKAKLLEEKLDANGKFNSWED